ncbi:hypothetical protein JM654_16005 [Microbacterium oxydans]|nr:hypothetical protein [Microbacterium oxydans]
MNLAFILIGILITWLVIYSAVRAALTSHRQAMARTVGPVRCDRRASIG